MNQRIRIWSAAACGAALAVALAGCAAGSPAASRVAATPAAVSPATPATSPAMTSQATPPAASTPSATASVLVSKGDKVSTATCTSEFCAYVVVTTSGFTGPVSCSVSQRQETFGVAWTQGASEKKQSPNYYGFPGFPVTVTCSTTGQSASGSLTW